MKLSIITINYNNAVGLAKTLDSVFQQSFLDYEHIIVDGASTDDSICVIREYQKKVKCKLIVISEPDTGIYNAMNKGIANAIGEYLNFMNSGDTYYSPDSLSKVFALNPSAETVIGNSITFDGKKKVRYNDASSENYDLEFFAWGSLPHQAMFIKNTVFKKFGGYDESLKIVSDWKHTIETIYLGDISTKYIDVDVCMYEGDGVSVQKAAYIEKYQVLYDIFHKKVIDDYGKALGFKKEIADIKKYFLTRILYCMLICIVHLFENVRKYSFMCYLSLKKQLLKLR